VSLWQQAIDSLPPSTIQSLDPARTGKRDIALAALEEAERKRQLASKKRWRIAEGAGGGDVIVRDVVEKIIGWINRFKAVGDQMVQYDPGHAALPWAAVRFLLQAAVNESAVYSELVLDLEMVTRLLATIYELESVYLTGAGAL